MNGIYAGSFDPFTRGHLEVVENMLPILPQICILVGTNPNKTQLRSVEDRIKMIELALSEYIKQGRVVVKTLPPNIPTVIYAKQKGYSILIRGMRNMEDFNDEKNLMLVNKSICQDIKTIYTITNSPHLSSTNVRALFQIDNILDTTLLEYIQPEVLQYIREHNLYNKGEV